MLNKGIFIPTMRDDKDVQKAKAFREFNYDNDKEVHVVDDNMIKMFCRPIKSNRDIFRENALNVYSIRFANTIQTKGC
jgi:hypothetical protein